MVEEVEQILETVYTKQKEKIFNHFKININDIDKINNKTFTIFDFITNSFNLSKKRKQQAIDLMLKLKEKEITFIQAKEEMNISKSSLYLICLSLSRSGLIEFEKNKPLKLTNKFCETINSYSTWWNEFVLTPNSQSTTEQKTEPISGSEGSEQAIP